MKGEPEDIDTIREVVGPCQCATSGQCDFCSLVIRLGLLDVLEETHDDTAHRR